MKTLEEAFAAVEKKAGETIIKQGMRLCVFGRRTG